jgi:hypothetical protein
MQQLQLLRLVAGALRGLVSDGAAASRDRLGSSLLCHVRWHVARGVAVVTHATAPHDNRELKSDSAIRGMHVATPHSSPAK